MVEWDVKVADAGVYWAWFNWATAREIEIQRQMKEAVFESKWWGYRQKLDLTMMYMARMEAWAERHTVLDLLAYCVGAQVQIQPQLVADLATCGVVFPGHVSARRVLAVDHLTCMIQLQAWTKEVPIPLYGLKVVGGG